MKKEQFIREIEVRLTNLSDKEISEEIASLNEFIENGKRGNISEVEIIKSLGTVDDLVETIYLKRGMKLSNKVSLKDNILNIGNGIKIVFQSKDKKLILKSIKNIFIIVLVAIIIKIPFIFVKTLLLDFLNSINTEFGLQDLISIGLEIIYIIIATLYVYKRLKICFGNQKKSI